jgi:hypothetical protein
MPLNPSFTDANGRTITMTVSGQQAVLKALARELGPEMSKRAAIGLTAAAPLVAAEGRRRVAKHGWHGTLEGSIHPKPVHYLPLEAWVNISADAPQAKSFGGGWYSKVGKQPPSDMLEAWVTSKGFASTPREAQQIAFVIARRMAGGRQVARTAGAMKRAAVTGDTRTSVNRYGYSFPPTHFLKNALRYTKIPVLNILIARMKAAGRSTF